MSLELFLPIYNQLLGENLKLHLFSDIKLVCLILGMGLIIGIGAGSYPALILSRFSPTALLRSSKGADSTSGSKLRAILVITQFATSIGLMLAKENKVAKIIEKEPQQCFVLL